MAVLNLPNYLNNLNHSTPTIIHQHTGHVLSAIEPQSVLLPPINTDIQISKFLPQYNIHAHPNVLSASRQPLPETWNWRDIFPSDDSETKRKKKLITPVGNQSLCGSCWAYNSVEFISDNFVVQNITKYNPNLSSTYCLACYPQNQCKGGNPAKLLNDIATNGIATNHCIDYSWCLENPACSGSGVKHLSQTKDLNSLIPQCGCYYGDNHYIYHIADPQNLVASNDEDVQNITTTVKYHIKEYGPVGGAYIVLANFVSGNYTKSGGVYLEDVDYNSNNYYLPQQAKVIGGHLVSIMGWGVAKNVKHKLNGKDTTGDVPYWYCRNSWKETWGKDKGYFKIAMYPYNKISQFERQVMINTDSGQIMNGGIVTLKAKGVSPSKFSAISHPKQLLESDSFYQNEPDPKSDGGNGGNIIGNIFHPDNKKVWLPIIIILSVLIVGGGLYWLKKKGKLRKLMFWKKRK